MVINFKDIKIPQSYTESKPNQQKYDNCAEFYKVHGYIDKPLVVTNVGTLRDGYIRYLILKDAGFTGDINVKLVKGYPPKTYVKARHEGKSKLYTWKVPDNYSGPGLIPGLRINVNTSKGRGTAVVDSVFESEIPPVNGLIRSICKGG